MKTDRISPDGREVHELWTWSEDFKLIKVNAWKNKGNESFWVPYCGFTTTVGSSCIGVLHETKAEAFFAANVIIARLKQNLANHERNLEASRLDFNETAQ